MKESEVELIVPFRLGEVFLKVIKPKRNLVGECLQAYDLLLDTIILQVPHVKARKLVKHRGRTTKPQQKAIVASNPHELPAECLSTQR